MIQRYAELGPDELAGALAARPVAYVPWGALEWHGSHLPLGLDGLVAEAFAERLAERLGGVLLPTYWLPVTPIEHAASLGAPAAAVAQLLTTLLAGLARAGCRLACVVSGHYAQGHELILVEAAERAMSADPGLLVLGGTPLALLGDQSLLDHAGRWETAQLLAVRPDLVHLERLAPEAPRFPPADAVLGADPRLARAADGVALLARAEEAWAGWVERLLAAQAGRGRAELAPLYAARREDYRAWVERYYSGSGSWEQAAERWWASVRARVASADPGADERG